jgi:CheY-like chemotaxis protein
MAERLMSILMVDDSEDDIFLATRAIAKASLPCNLHTSSSVQEAKKYLQGQDQFADRTRFPFPDLLMLDLHMPLMDGFDLLRWLRDHPLREGLPTIVFSASSEEQDVQKAYSLGATAYLTKPCSLHELQDLLRLTHHFWSQCRFPRRIQAA